MFPELGFPDLSIADPVNNGVDWIVAHWGTFFRSLSNWMRDYLLNPINRSLQWVPPYLFIVLVGGLAWHATRKWTMALGLMLGLFLIGSFGLWNKMLLTTTLMLVSTLVSVLIGLPTGILMARSDRFRNMTLPVLDVMQTMPSFVYLIPVIMLFSLGQVPAVIATVIYALPPLIRLTDLGIRQVDGEVIEAARSFGTTPQQLLWRVQLPLARPSIMAGTNQTIMMALAMVVLASMIGARGLGQDVLAGINTLDIGVGLQGGIAIVILAIVIDRITQGYGMDRRARHKLSGPSNAQSGRAAQPQEVKA